MPQLESFWSNHIDGEWIPGGAAPIDVTDPATGAVLCRQAMADAADVNRAVAAARRVHDSGALKDMRPVERARLVQGMGRFIEENAGDIARTLTLEQGKPLWESRIEVSGAARFFEYYGNQADTLEGRSIPLGAGYLDFTDYEPYGVTAHIVPWNFPFEMTARSMAPALATGNTCIVKTPELTPLSNAWLARAAEAVGLPPGAVNVICGHGPEAGAALAGHPDVNLVVFTGSVPTGVAIARAAANNVVPSILELGGKSAAIVHDDADLDAFETDMRYGIFFNAGQICSAMSRVIVHQSRHDELVERAAKLANSLSVGPGIDRGTDGPTMGAMVSLAQRDRALAMVSSAGADGAKVVAGGRSLNIPGAFLEPTVVTGVSPASEIAQQEVFGPVLTVLPFRTDAEAIEIANGTQYGLVGGVFTADLDRATRAARAIRGGQIFVNEWFAGGVETPFGGVGKSGYGREKGREALFNYVQTKNIAIRMR
ncbi:aldehyde dehydrogenase family protein [Leisingera daeponensis]|uniref:Aldehyde dehydrogenase family protein n=1 Tax=Leisingera daeponensis TaxID=405746 RepID=A0ABS7NLT8_9RHOB|nr:aldehyde dehydrogenase family protein [Leisingera daeponensis]MBY6142165.1 aldehyde dehydrogenase family protein [Leisingera daeponensis]